MTAGSGILHSEVNPSADEETHLLQIWIEPARRGMPASYEQRPLPLDAMAGRWHLVASPDGAAGSATIGQDARLWATRQTAGSRLEYSLAGGRLAYVHVIAGQLELNGTKLAAGDGAKIADETELRFAADGDAELLLFDLPPIA